MRFIRTLGVALAFGAAISCSTTPNVAPNPTNILDTYVARPDPSFAWKVANTFSGDGYHGVVIDLTSQTWLSDITCIPTEEGWLYLVGHKDLCTRKIVGYAMSERMTRNLVIESLRRAVEVRRER